LDFAIANKLYDPQKEPFNFFKIFISNTAHDQTYNYPRVKTLLQMYSNISYEGNDGLYPVFVRPKKKMSVQDVARGLRNKYDGTPHDPYQSKNPKEPYRPISVIRSSISHITQTRKDMPEDLASVQYIALGMTDLAAYIPFYKGITNIPQQYQGAKEKADDHSSFWKYRKLQALTMQDYARFAPIVHEAIAKLEKDISERQAKMEKECLKVFRKDPKAARKLIQAFTDKTVSKQDDMLNRLIGKISKMLGMENLTNEQYTEMIKKIEAEYHFHGA
jgi:dipeptidase